MVLKVLEGSFVIEFGGEAMVAKPESYQATSQLASKDDDESSSTPVLGIALGVVFGILAVILIVGVLLLVRKFCLTIILKLNRINFFEKSYLNSNLSEPTRLNYRIKPAKRFLAFESWNSTVLYLMCLVKNVC